MKMLGKIVLSVIVLLSVESTTGGYLQAAAPIKVISNYASNPITDTTFEKTLKDGRKLVLIGYTYSNHELQLKKGKSVLWSKKFTGTAYHLEVNNSTIFVAERDRNYTLPKTLYVLDLTGKIMSKTSVEGYLPEFYIWKDKTIVNTRNSISMYNAKGEIQWKKDLEIHVQTTPRVLSDETVLIRDADNTVHAIDKSGNIIWIFTNPLYLDHELFNIGKDNSLIGALEGNRAYLIGISKSGKKLWETKLPSLHSTPNELHILANGNILFHSFKEIYDVKTSKSSYFQSIGVIDQQGKLLWNKTFAGADLHKKNLQADKYSNIYLSTTLKPNGIFNSNFYVYRPNGDLVYKYQNSPYFITKILDFDKMHAIGEGLQYNKESKMYRSTEKWYKIQLPSFSKK